MQKFVFSLLCLSLFACGQKPATKNSLNKTHQANEKTTIEFKEKMHNFGSLSAGEIVLITFEFTNTGSANYVIDNIHTDCGCVKASFDKQAVKPGNTGRIEVEFDTSGLVGREYKSIEINGNSKELKHLAIFAEVKNELLDIKN